MNEEPRTNSLKYHFVESPHYREIYADGVWGGLHSSGYIQMAIFKDKSYLPTSVEYNVHEGGRLEETNREVPTIITRELEADVRLTLTTAVLMRDWLDEKIAELTPPEQSQD
ncbi:MAG: hypothetical protein OXI16_07455 [Chloroflexota bacterium]|nr:hypothetical protein [Chloroflexota bacterium]